MGEPNNLLVVRASTVDYALIRIYRKLLYNEYSEFGMDRTLQENNWQSDT